MDADELEKIQMLVESWKDNLPEDLQQYGPKLRQVADDIESANRVTVSRLPLVGSVINAAINGILDMRG